MNAMVHLGKRAADRAKNRSKRRGCSPLLPAAAPCQGLAAMKRAREQVEDDSEAHSRPHSDIPRRASHQSCGTATREAAAGTPSRPAAAEGSQPATAGARGGSRVCRRHLQLDSLCAQRQANFEDCAGALGGSAGAEPAEHSCREASWELYLGLPPLRRRVAGGGGSGHSLKLPDGTGLPRPLQGRPSFGAASGREPRPPRTPRRQWSRRPARPLLLQLVAPESAALEAQMREALAGAAGEGRRPELRLHGPVTAVAILLELIYKPATSQALLQNAAAEQVRGAGAPEPPSMAGTGVCCLEGQGAAGIWLGFSAAPSHATSAEPDRGPAAPVPGVWHGRHGTACGGRAVRPALEAACAGSGAQRRRRCRRRLAASPGGGR